MNTTGRSVQLDMHRPSHVIFLAGPIYKVHIRRCPQIGIQTSKVFHLGRNGFTNPKFKLVFFFQLLKFRSDTRLDAFTEFRYDSFFFFCVSLCFLQFLFGLFSTVGCNIFGHFFLLTKIGIGDDLEIRSHNSSLMRFFRDYEIGNLAFLLLALSSRFDLQFYELEFVPQKRVRRERRPSGNVGEGDSFSGVGIYPVDGSMRSTPVLYLQFCALGIGRT
mmetsp:Transcript_102241/g.153173  ORF Transcript_102241/g.153173 Transcript_102241/m.153173 type:complete len:218 (-) Transcript_102241:147-800(-)